MKQRSIKLELKEKPCHGAKADPLGGSLDDVRSLLGNGVESGHKVAANLERQDTGIDDADVAGAVDLEVGIDNTAQLL